MCRDRIADAISKVWLLPGMAEFCDKDAHANEGKVFKNIRDRIIDGRELSTRSFDLCGATAAMVSRDGNGTRRSDPAGTAKRRKGCRESGALRSAFLQIKISSSYQFRDVCGPPNLLKMVAFAEASFHHERGTKRIARMRRHHIIEGFFMKKREILL